MLGHDVGGDAVVLALGDGSFGDEGMRAAIGAAALDTPGGGRIDAGEAFEAGQAGGVDVDEAGGLSGSASAEAGMDAFGDVVGFAASVGGGGAGFGGGLVGGHFCADGGALCLPLKVLVGLLAGTGSYEQRGREKSEAGRDAKGWVTVDG